MLKGRGGGVYRDCVEYLKEDEEEVYTGTVECLKDEEEVYKGAVRNT